MLDRDRLKRMHEVLGAYAQRGDVPGLVWAVARAGRVEAGTAGTLAVDGAPVGRDSIFRISSMTKPVTAVATLILVEECLLRLDDAVDRLLPELGDRRVFADPNGGAIEDTVPARRSITVRDLLTFRGGSGMDFRAGWPQPAIEAMTRLELAAAPPQPATPPEPDEWMRRMGTLPLQYQPGERWLYDTGTQILGVLVARAAGQPFDAFLRERIFEPLGMHDTGFSVPDVDLWRFGPCYAEDPSRGRVVYDETDGQWSRPPAFPNGSAGLVSTVDDYLAFAEMLLAGGARGATRILARPTVELMTTNHLTDEQLAVSGPEPTGARGWGFGVGVQVRRTGVASLASYGWDGGMGSSWANDPAEDLAGVLLTNQMWSSPEPPPVSNDFWTCAYAALDD
jgi:CubicO group peptidase (beta-lactamase class C family)